ncbi:MAG: alpha/beta hydrolase [Oscillospiraceae bacterium]|nr:alpha/beta hydrolase [Oscillospiraceae bacterium]
MKDSDLIPVYMGSPDQFPASPELPNGVTEVKWADEGGCMIEFHLNEVYDERDGETLHLQILLPLEEMPMFGLPTKKYPLIVYVPGSAWRKQMPMMALPRMMRLCEQGYAVAVVEYRPSDAAGFPAQAEDCKTAIRFMRKHADKYRILPDKIALYGDSSGGHTVVLAGITGDGTLDNGVYGEFSSEVKCIVDSFGPTDVSKMNFYPSMMDHTAPDSPEGMLLGGVNVLEHPELAEKASPMYYLSHEKAIPPILIMHGDQDWAVPFNQSVRLYDKMRELDKDVTMYKLLGGFHGSGGFNSKEARDTILEFINKHI